MDWGSVADWVSGIGSLSAAISALYLARRTEGIRLSGHCGLRVIIGGDAPTLDVVTIGVTNVGTRATTINNISMSVGRFKKKRHAIIPFPRDRYSVGLPHSLSDGEVALWRVPLDASKSWIRDLCDGFILNQGDVETLRFHVHTNHGASLTMTPEAPLLNAISGALNARHASAERP